MRLGEMCNHTFVFYRFFQTVASHPERARVRVRVSANTENTPFFFSFQTEAQIRAGTGSCCQLAASQLLAASHQPPTASCQLPAASCQLASQPAPAGGCTSQLRIAVFWTQKNFGRPFGGWVQKNLNPPVHASQLAASAAASQLATASSVHFKKFFSVEFCEFCDESWSNLHARLKMFLKTRLECRPEGYGCLQKTFLGCTLAPKNQNKATNYPNN